jgi:hypothetical protein
VSIFVQESRRVRDKLFVTRFMDNAARIFEAAESAASAGHSLSDMTILIGQTGGIHMVAGSDWPLASLQAQHGARMAYRVSQQAASVRVDGRAGWQTCLLETAKPEQIARHLLGDRREYVLAAPRQLSASSM